jgi:predicted RNase H-like HicB family nuclease
MTEPDKLLHIVVEYYDGQEEGDIGSPYYVASCDAIGLTTDGGTMDELFKNLREAIELALDEEDTIATYNVIPNPRINIIMELSDYAQIA